MSKSKYITAAVTALAEMGGGPVSSHELFQAIVDKGLLPDRKYLYNNVLQRIRSTPEIFDTSVRGKISLLAPAAMPVAEVPAPAIPAAPEEAAALLASEG